MIVLCHDPLNIRLFGGTRTTLEASLVITPWDMPPGLGVLESMNFNKREF